MKVKNLIILLVISALVIGACSQQPANAPSTTPAAAPPEKPQLEVNTPPVVQAQPETASGIADEVRDLITKYRSRATSIHYLYKGPQTSNNFYEFYIKGGKIRYLPSRALKALDKPESWDTIYLDAVARTSASYCDDSSCIYKGKKSDLEFDEAYIATPYDWLNVKEAAKIGEEVIDDRQTWKLQTDKGIVWVDSFYGIPLKAQSNNDLYFFKLTSANDIQDSDVTPK